MTDSVYSFVYNRRSAIKALRQSDPQRMLLAVLAGITPQKRWEGCLVYLGDSPLEEGGSSAAPETLCVGIRGPGADEVQEQLVLALERFGVQVVELYEGGPEVQRALARTTGGRWGEP